MTPLLLLLGFLIGPGGNTTGPAGSLDLLPPETDSVHLYTEEIRAATQRFQTHDAAVAAGYRWMGPDMPNMGEHWINPRLVMRPFDLKRPSSLTYLKQGDDRILTGVAYILPVRPDAPLPTLPGDPVWHFHSSTLVDEAFGHRPHHSKPTGDGVRLAMLHVWVWTDNPDGIFAADNWALSYVRHGFAAPSPVDPRAAMALFLPTEEGLPYFMKVVATNTAPTPDELNIIRNALARARSQVVSAMQAAPDGTAPPLSTLTAIWTAAWQDVADNVDMPLWMTLRSIMLDSTSH